jgi:Fur family ferric uptake transcriptional regulator
VTHELLQWEDVLRKSGHRVTKQRGIILDAVCDGGGHTALGEVFARAHRVDASLDRSTVYRALKVFVNVGLVVAADTGDGETYYEIKRPEQHHHLVCRQCGAEQEIDDSVLLTMFDRVNRQHGFQVATDHLVLFGTCARCLAGLDVSG